jgi:hypothetical protein
VRRSQEPSARSGTSRTIGVANGLTCTNPPGSKWSNGRRPDRRLGFLARFDYPHCSESEIGQSGESFYDQNLTAQNKAQTVELGKRIQPCDSDEAALQNLNCCDYRASNKQRLPVRRYSRLLRAFVRHSRATWSLSRTSGTSRIVHGARVLPNGSVQKLDS